VERKRTVSAEINELHLQFCFDVAGKLWNTWVVRSRTAKTVGDGGFELRPRKT
jgi:hypothetical protein